MSFVDQGLRIGNLVAGLLVTATAIHLWRMRRAAGRKPEWWLIAIDLAAGIVNFLVAFYFFPLCR